MSARNANSIALTPQWARWIDDLVANGEYQSASEVVRDGLRALHDDRERREAELAEIRARLQRALMEADAGTLAEGSGEAAVKRAFDRARSHVCVKPWRLTRRAEDSLVEIFAWTLDRFGERQALAYRDTLIERIDAIAAGQPPHPRPCGLLMGVRPGAKDLVYYREGGHYSHAQFGRGIDRA